MRTRLPGVGPQLSAGEIFRTWWPLAASWVLMGAELPAFSAVMARLPNPAINLAAYGGIVYPIALIIESPIIMLLAASTALSKDLPSYRKLYRFMMASGAVLTLVQILVAVTPLYYVVARDLIGAPAVILEPARVGLIIMIPWTWSIAYRRFQQGLLIRFGHSRAVGLGTVVRLTADCLVLTAGFLAGNIPGIVVATSAVIAGVLSEAVYAGLVARPIVRDELPAAPIVSPALTRRAFLAFYMPLVLTSLLTLLAQPIGSAALSRMPAALPSLAVWPVVTGLVFMLRGLGIGYNEVVVALLDKPRSAPALRRFAYQLAALTSGALLVLAATPLSGFWFGAVSALDPYLANLAQAALWIAIPMPALAVLQSWYQGTILHSRRTRGISEAVVIYLLVSVLILGFGVIWHGAAGIYLGMAALVASTAAQTGWLYLRARPAMRQLAQSDAVPA